MYIDDEDAFNVKMILICLGLIVLILAIFISEGARDEQTYSKEKYMMSDSTYIKDSNFRKYTVSNKYAARDYDSESSNDNKTRMYIELISIKGNTTNQFEMTSEGYNSIDTYIYSRIEKNKTYDTEFLTLRASNKFGCFLKVKGLDEKKLKAAEKKFDEDNSEYIKRMKPLSKSVFTTYYNLIKHRKKGEFYIVLNPMTENIQVKTE